MPFLNIPIKSIGAELISLASVQAMPWYSPSDFPVQPGAAYPAPAARDFKWQVVLSIELQQQSSHLTRNPGVYDGQDITVGQWISNITSGKAWQIISIESKESSQVTAIVQDIYRYNTFRDPLQNGNGAPDFGAYVIFNTSDSGLPQIDPIPSSGVSEIFTQNLQSRFEYINLQYDYPLYQESNTFIVNDVIAVNSTTNSFVLANGTYKMVIGVVTSISDTIPGWFTINPVQKIVDFLDYLPGDVGDIIYSSTTAPGGITTDQGGAALYIKLRNQSSSVSYSRLQGPTNPGSVMQVNGIDIEIGGTGSQNDLVSATNLESAATGVVANTELLATVVETNIALISSAYGEIALYAASTPATATINGSLVTFNIQSTTPGYEDYTQAEQMAAAINNANIANIVASAPTVQYLILTNLIGGPINIVNVLSDINGVNFAGSDSGSGIPLLTPASTVYTVKFTANDASAINFLDVTGTPIGDFGLISVENGTKACGLYIEGGLRAAVSTVVTDLTQLNALTPLIGDTAYVIDSNDGNGNSAGEWSMWIFDGNDWIQTSNQDSATTDAKSLEYMLTTGSPSEINISEISTGRRITLITIEVLTPFNSGSTVSIGYQVNNPLAPPAVPAGLMPVSLSDLTIVGTYSTSTDVLFGTDTEQGDVTITANFAINGATEGSAQIIVSYV